MTTTWARPLENLLGEFEAHLLAARGREAHSLMGFGMTDLYLEALEAGDADNFIQIARAHPVYHVAYQDPFTKRCVDKPRGYAGDAVMLDYLYSRTAPEGTTDIGKLWFSFTATGSCALSVRYRKALLQAFIDDTVVRCPNYQIFSVASGHCRELAESLVFDNKFSGRFVAFDQDSESCALVEREYAARAERRVEVIRQGIRQLFIATNPLIHQRFDLIYSAGLYDYLDEKTARALTRILRSMLRPGGRLVLANFTPHTAERGYMAAMMDWHLIFRTPAELVALFGKDVADQVSHAMDPHVNVVYAEYRAPSE